jgi:hypothetical protein
MMSVTLTTVELVGLYLNISVHPQFKLAGNRMKQIIPNGVDKKLSLELIRTFFPQCSKTENCLPVYVVADLIVFVTLTVNLTLSEQTELIKYES